MTINSHITVPQSPFGWPTGTNLSHADQAKAMTDDELRQTERTAREELNRRFRVKAQAVEDRLATGVPFVPEELVYAARSRCTCGAGYAYPTGCSPMGFWRCSALLLDPKRFHKEQHSADLPFAFYEIKSEGQPSAQGATTRPQE